MRSGGGSEKRKVRSGGKKKKQDEVKKKKKREMGETERGMWAMLKPFNSNQHHVSSRALLSHKWTLLRQQSALELCKNIKGASPVSARSQE